MLKALKILGLEEMLKLAEILNSKAVPLKRAAGEDLVVWSEPEPQNPKKDSRPDAKVLSFKTTRAADLEEAQFDESKSEVKNENQNHFVSAEMMMWQKELTKDSELNLHKREAVNGYKKSADMYVVKTTEVDGKEKIRIASTRGVLIDKKQA